MVAQARDAPPLSHPSDSPDVFSPLAWSDLSLRSPWTELQTPWTSPFSPVFPLQSLVLCPLPTRTPGRGTHKLVASFVHAVLQVAVAIVGGQDGSQLPVACKVEAIIGGEHQQPRDIAPANFLLRKRRRGYLPRFPPWSPHRGELTRCCAPFPPGGQDWFQAGQPRDRTQAGTSFSTRVQAPVPGAGGTSLQ